MNKDSKMNISFSGKYFVQIIEDRHKKSIDIDEIKLKLKTATDINYQAEHNLRTVLHYAVLNNLSEFTKALLEVPNIDVNLQDKIGMSPLHLAVYNKNEEMINLLLANGADILLEDNRGFNAYKIAKKVECSHTEILILNQMHRLKQVDRDLVMRRFTKRKSEIKKACRNKKIGGAFKK